MSGLACDAVCEVRCVSPFGPSCTRKESADEDQIIQDDNSPVCGAPASVLSWQPAYTNMLRYQVSDEAFPQRRAIALPGAWAIGEGLLLEYDEQDEQGSIPWPYSAAQDSPDGSVADGWTATMGSYLNSLAQAISSCSAPANSSADGTSCSGLRNLRGCCWPARRATSPAFKKED